MKRRGFLLTGAAALPALPAFASANADPVLSIFEKWAETVSVWEAYTRQPQGNVDPAAATAIAVVLENIALGA